MHYKALSMIRFITCFPAIPHARNTAHVESHTYELVFSTTPSPSSAAVRTVEMLSLA